jgi:hypothetical protein
MDADSEIRVPIKARTHELNQLQAMLPDVRDGLAMADLDEAADEVDRIYTEYVEGVEAEYPEGPEFANYISMPAEDWRLTVRYLNRLRAVEGLRVSWLQNKLVDRLRDRLEEMED